MRPLSSLLTRGEAVPGAQQVRHCVSSPLPITHMWQVFSRWSLIQEMGAAGHPVPSGRQAQGRTSPASLWAAPPIPVRAKPVQALHCVS